MGRQSPGKCETLFSGADDFRISRFVPIACSRMLKNLLMLLSFLLPWAARRRFLESQFGYSIHPSSHIGLAWICPQRLIMEENARIGNLTLCKNIDLLHLGAHAI